jgi:SAM-dependent methyltransferase
MADALLDLDERPEAVADPACGAGALLLAVVERARARGLPVPTFLAFDRDPAAVAACRATLAAAGCDASLRLEVRDVLAEGLDLPAKCALLANPPWGVRVDGAAAAAWRSRAPAEELGEARGELSAYVLFLSECLRQVGAAVFLTPIHWLHRRSHWALRSRLAAERRLRALHVLRKGVFEGAPDMIPVVTAWSAQASPAPVSVTHTGWGAELPLPYPLPRATSASWDATTWSRLPFAVVPLLRPSARASDGDRLMCWPQAIADATGARHPRWFHCGDGVYKSRVVGALVSDAAQHPGDLPFVVRAAALRRYRLDASAPPLRLPAARIAELVSATDRRRFAGPKLVLHAMKKANAPWRLCAALHEPRSAEDALGFSNNFVLLTRDAYDGDLRYPLALLNSRVYNALYTDHFPGVNIEAYTLGALPFPWPAPAPLYERLCALAQRMRDGRGADADADLAIERVVAELLGVELAPAWLAPVPP